MSTLAQLEARISSFLFDPTNLIFTTAAIDEGLRLALDEYTRLLPLTSETFITLPGTGREIALNGITGLTGVLDVWWPYDSTTEEWPPNRVQGFRLYWDDAQPLLILGTKTGGQPQIDDEVRVWYTRAHTIQNLDAAATTTPPATHESLLVLGGAGFAALSRAIDLNEDATLNTSGTPNYAVLGSRWRREFTRQIAALSAATHLSEPWGQRGWQLDKWDT